MLRARLPPADRLRAERAARRHSRATARRTSMRAPSRRRAALARAAGRRANRNCSNCKKRATARSAGFAATRQRAGARRRACSRRPARSTSPKARRPITGGSRARSSPRVSRRRSLHNCFSYHFTPAGSMLETGAHALGCTVFPGGTGQTEQQVRAMADLQPDGYVGTPSFLRSSWRRPTSWASRCRR